MQEVLSSLNPYKFESTNLNYEFVTDQGVGYFVYFTEGTGYFDNYPEFCNDIVSFGFAPRNSKLKAFSLDSNGEKIRERVLDLRVRDTICCILEEFLGIFPQKSFISICDNADLREVCRRKLFNYWHRDVDRLIATRVTKYDSAIHGAEQFFVYASIFIRNDNPMHEEIKDAFFNVSNDLIAKGY